MAGPTRHCADVPAIRKDAFHSREMDGDLLLYDRERDAVHTLNPTARLIYECCDGRRSAEEIVGRVAGKYGLRPSAVRLEVEGTLHLLKKLDVATAAETPARNSGRRDFIATALQGAALLPFAAPVVETLFLQDAGAVPPSQVGPPPTDPPPSVTSCDPDNGDQGNSFEVLVKGSDFTATPTVSFGSGITVNYVTYVNQGRIRVGITISGVATPGTRDVTVTNPDTQFGTLVSGFTVNATPVAPTVTSCTPSNGNKGQTLIVTIGGTNFQATPTVSFNYNKITVNSVTFVGSTTLTVSISITSNAKSGSRDITVTNPGGLNGTLSNGFTIN